MNLTNEYDVFIAFHGSGDENGSSDQAKIVYDYLKANGKKCFLFTQENGSIYKANFIKIMKSKLFLLVCNDNLEKKNTGEMDNRKNYHLYVECDAFYALTQSEESDKALNDARVAMFSVGGKHKMAQSPERLHPLFNNRDSFQILDPEDYEDGLDDLLDWVESRLDAHYNADVSSEVIAVLTGRVDVFSREVEGINFRKVMRKATQIKCIGISNWTFSLNDGCKKLINALRNGATAEMLFINPDGESAKIRAIEENKDTRAQIISSFDMLKAELSKAFKDSPDRLNNLKTYVYDLLPRDNLVFVYTEKEAYAFVQSYSHSLPGSANPYLIVKRSKQGDSPLFSYYESIYNYVLNNKKATTEYNLFAEGNE
ncbi:MAG: hypothetical protein K2O39_05710 [Clostridiales bacterium]|nr:hypothetical protein [Clostridiales bacterium]